MYLQEVIELLLCLKVRGVKCNEQETLKSIDMTKTTVLAVLFFACSFGLLQAQTNQGNLTVGTSSSLNLIGSDSDIMGFGFSTVKFKSDRTGFQEEDADKVASFNLSPEVGYFVIDNLAVGIDLNVGTSKVTEGTSNDSSTDNLIAAGPFVRYYIPTTRVLPFVEVGASFGRVITKYDGGFLDGEEFKTNLRSIGGGVGVAAPLGDKVTLDIMAGYQSITIKADENNDDNDRTVTGTIALRLGFTVFLGAN